MSISSRAPKAEGHEGGYTLIELMVVVLLFSIFGVAVQTSMSAFARTTRVTDDKTSAVASVRVAEEAIARDLRAANPIDDIDPEAVTNYQNKVRFAVYCATGTPNCVGNLRQVTYQLVSNRLEQVIGSNTRVLVGPNGQSAVPLAERLGSVVNTSTDPVFTYLDKDGQPFEIVSTGQAVSTRTIHDCTKAVEIHLKVISEPRKTTTPYNLVTTVELRNFNEVDGC